MESINLDKGIPLAQLFFSYFEAPSSNLLAIALIAIGGMQCGSPLPSMESRTAPVVNSVRAPESGSVVFMVFVFKVCYFVFFGLLTLRGLTPPSVGTDFESDFGLTFLASSDALNFNSAAAFIL